MKHIEPLQEPPGIHYDTELELFGVRYVSKGDLLGGAKNRMGSLVMKKGWIQILRDSPRARVGPRHPPHTHNHADWWVTVLARLTVRTALLDKKYGRGGVTRRECKSHCSLPKPTHAPSIQDYLFKLAESTCKEIDASTVELHPCQKNKVSTPRQNPATAPLDVTRREGASPDKEDDVQVTRGLFYVH